MPPHPSTTNVLLIGGGRVYFLARKLTASKRLGSLFATHTESPCIARFTTATQIIKPAPRERKADE